MDIFFICLAAFVTAILTFFSGFGLGTILTPVFMIFFPVDLAIALTGVVHFFNNIFKLVLVGKNADRKVLIRFGIPAVIAAVAGAWLLLNITDLEPLFTYRIGERNFEGNQGALRSAFLIKAGLSKEAFIGTAVVVSTFVDFTRLSVYATRFTSAGLMDNWVLVTCATLSAVAGAYLGNKLLKKVTLRFLQVLVAIMLIVISIALGIGLI